MGLLSGERRILEADSPKKLPSDSGRFVKTFSWPIFFQRFFWLGLPRGGNQLARNFSKRKHEEIEVPKRDTKAHVYKPLGDRDPLLLAYFILAPWA